MTKNGSSKKKVLLLGSATALILSLAGVPNEMLASLAIEIFPKAYKEDRYWAGTAKAIGLVLAFYSIIEI